MKIQTTHPQSDRGLDAYFTPIEAIQSLMEIETLPHSIWEPAAGNGAITLPLQNAGHNVISSDIFDYGLKHCIIQDFLKFSKPKLMMIKIDQEVIVTGIVTNPPFKLALEFIKRSLEFVAYSAFLLRTNFLESTSRMEFFQLHPPTRIWISSRRLPMMHRWKYDGPKAPSNTCHAWFIWDQRQNQIPQPQQPQPQLNWFDWQNHTKSLPPLPDDNFLL